MATGGKSLSLQSSLKPRKKEKKSMMKTIKMLTEALKENTMFLKMLIQENQNLLTIIRKNNNSNDDGSQVSADETNYVSDDSDVWEANYVGDNFEDEDNNYNSHDDCSQVSADEINYVSDDSDVFGFNYADDDFEDENQLATSILEGHNSNEGKRYKFHKVVRLVSTRDVGVRHGFITFEAKDPDAAYELCTFRAKIDDYGGGESYVDYCREI